MDAWRKTAEEYLWMADILSTMGRYSGALLLLCHAYDVCMKWRNGDQDKTPFKYVPKECPTLIFPSGDETPEDLVTLDHVIEMSAKVKKCLGLQ
ncbi:hypothetical protein EYM_06780 [Ignicoccus islandicus DSM 13165]|uniref:HEPN domain-containing protein n=1 Tax=Ignicoccus islandicus DSM 13165 TaxID=940295 RepID=A0A0U3FTC9_9CREN|nr:hypothetical protein [Ignicoccus islandicus]ALU12720.1 hypothetical protein EYM_06780 [Ignicoccus islandicus DSM 13165]